MDTIIEYEAGIENDDEDDTDGDYEIDNTFIKFRGEADEDKCTTDTNAQTTVEMSPEANVISTTLLSSLEAKGRASRPGYELPKCEPVLISSCAASHIHSKPHWSDDRELQSAAVRGLVGRAGIYRRTPPTDMSERHLLNGCPITRRCSNGW